MSQYLNPRRSSSSSRSRSRSRSPRRPLILESDMTGVDISEPKGKELASPAVAPYAYNPDVPFARSPLPPLPAFSPLPPLPTLEAQVFASSAEPITRRSLEPPARPRPSFSSDHTFVVPAPPPPAPSPALPPPPPPFNPNPLATSLYEACNTSDKDTVVDIVCRLPPHEVAQITEAFERMYRKKAYRHITERLGGLDRHFVALLEGCAAGVFEFDAIRLREALFSKFHVDHDTMVEILAGRPADDIRGIRAVYKSIYHTELDIDLFHRLYSPYKDLMMMIVDVDRRSPGPFALLEDVHALYDAGAGRPGTEDLTVFKILVDRPLDHVRRVALEYQKVYRRPLEDDISSEYMFKRAPRRALKLVVRSAISRPMAVAHMFDKALRVRSLGDIVDVAVGGSGADDGKLVRLMVEHRDFDVRDAIRREYQETRGKPLSGRIREVVKSADYLNALMVCLGERWSFERGRSFDSRRHGS